MKSKVLYSALSLLLIATLITGSFYIGNILPDYKDEIKVHTNYHSGILSYVNANEELLIYPWNLYDDDLPTVDLDPIIYDSTGLDVSVTELVQTYLDLLFPYFNHTYETDFSLIYQYDTNENIYYLKDYAYKNADDKDCILNIAIKEDQVVYFKCDYENITDYTQAQINEISDRLSQWLEEFLSVTEGYNNESGDTDYYDESNDTDFYSQLERMYYDTFGSIEDMYTNPFFAFEIFCRYLSEKSIGIANDGGYAPEHEPGFLYNYSLFSLDLRNVAIVYYEGCFILTNNNFNLFFDPATNSISGFSTSRGSSGYF